MITEHHGLHVLHNDLLGHALRAVQDYVLHTLPGRRMVSCYMCQVRYVVLTILMISEVHQDLKDKDDVDQSCTC